MTGFAPTGRPLHSDGTERRLSALGQRRMKFQCEIQAPGFVSQGFGQADGQPKIVGRTRCAIATFSAGSESSDGEGNRTESLVRYEIAVPRNVVVKEDFRLAEPAFFPSWETGKVYAINAVVSSPSQETGKGPYFQCLGTGVSGTQRLPEFGQIGSIVNDGNVRWKLVGYSTLYEVESLNDSESTPLEVALVCRKID